MSIDVTPKFQVVERSSSGRVSTVMFNIQTYGEARRVATVCQRRARYGSQVLVLRNWKHCNQEGRHDS